MLITITTDASYYHFTKESGYAFWISSNAGTFKKYGKLKISECSLEAELKCIANALYFAKNHKELWGISKIIVNTDSLNGICLLNKKYRTKKKRFTKILKEIFKQTKGIKTEYRFVRAHTDNSDKRSYTNNWADTYAKIGAKS
jgi:ribonuclease HI